MTPDPATPLGELIVQQMGEAVVYCDRHGIIQRWNQGAVRTFGFEPEEALGQSLDLLIPQHLRAAHWKGFDAAMSSGLLRLGGHPTRTRGLHKSGRRLYIEMSFSLVRNEGGDVLGSVAVARDATPPEPIESPHR